MNRFVSGDEATLREIQKQTISFKSDQNCSKRPFSWCSTQLLSFVFCLFVFLDFKCKCVLIIANIDLYYMYIICHNENRPKSESVELINASAFLFEYAIKYVANFFALSS